MSAKKSSRKKKEVDEDQPSLFERIGSDTIRGVSGILLFVLGILLVLAALGLAGWFGDKAFAGVYWLVGIGYFLLPLLAIGWALTLFPGVTSQGQVGSIRATGAGLFFFSFLTIVSVISSTHGGWLGNLVAHPMVEYLDTIATLVLLTGLLLVSLLLLFDSELWIMIGKKVLGLFKKPASTSESEAIETATDEEVEIGELETGEDDQTDLEEELEEDEESVEDEDELAELFDKPKKGAKRVKSRKQDVFVMPSEYLPPSVDLLEGDRGKPNTGDTKARANLIRKTLQHFKIPVEMDEIVVGPTVTRYALKPAAGVRLNKIVALQSNLELALAASPIRIEAPIPGKSLVGIEVPNTSKSIVGLAGLLSSPEFTEETVPLFVTLGKDIAGSAHYANIGKMPHLLVAGTTGSGKSVMIHSLITSLLYRNGPERLRLILVDPKRVELTLYNDIPHLLTPVITDAKRAILSLKWAAKEMDRRYDLLQENKVQDISGYHTEVVSPAHAVYEKQKSKGKDMTEFELPEPMPHIVIVIDELADIMSAYPRELESAIVRLAQMSRAVGIHLILSTQRPSVNVITGLIKANIPTRIALKVASVIDSRTILDQPGAEKLLGYGDMLYLSGDMAKPRRIQSPFLTTQEVKKITAFLTKHNDYMLDTPIDFSGGENSEGGGIPFDELEQNDELDDLYTEVRDFIIKERRASTSLIQRHFKVGYGRAARIMDQLEGNSVISASDGSNKPREVLMGGVEAEHIDEALQTNEPIDDEEEDDQEEYER